MNQIYLGGKIASKISCGSYPDGTPIVSFSLKESFKGSKNIFSVIVTGEENIKYCERLKVGYTVYVKGSIRSRNYQVKNAVVIRDGKQSDLKVHEFFVKAAAISTKPLTQS